METINKSSPQVSIGGRDPYIGQKNCGEPVDLRLKIKAFNLGEPHRRLASDRVDVDINGHHNMGALLHELSAEFPFMSSTSTNKPLSITIKVSSHGKNYKIYLPVIRKPGCLFIEEKTDYLFQVTVKSYDGRSTLHSTRQMTHVNPRILDEYFG